MFAALRLPYRQRLSLLVNELGTGLAGRPQDLNAAIRRANPALQQANRVLAILDRDRHVLGRLIDASDTVIGELARHRGEVTSFIGRADKVAQAVARPAWRPRRSRSTGCRRCSTSSSRPPPSSRG